MTSLVDIAPERLLIAGIGAGFLTPATDISALEDGALLTVSQSAASAISPPEREPNVATPTPGGKVYGFLPADLQLLAPNGGTTAAAALTSSKVLGLYFSAHWCPPCRGFTPKLAESYRKIKSAHGTAFEIVYVSSDRNEQDFAQYFAGMPWLAVPYHLRDLQTALGHMFGVSGI
ncbi:MAG: thioredoxin-like domain-containing protein, partial [Promethearchaeia archaeon]